MTQISRFWNGSTVGDAIEAPYDAPTEFAAVLRSLNGANANTSRSGVCRGELNQLAVTTAAGVNPISVNTGRAFVHGQWYENDAPVSFNLDATATARIDLVVLQKSFGAQTVRLAIHKGVDAVSPAIPAATQTTDPSTGVWELPLYQATIVAAGTITLTDVREYVPYLSSQYFEKIIETTLAATAATVTLPIGGVAYRMIIAVLDVCCSNAAGSGANALPVYMYFNSGDLVNHYMDEFYSFSGAQWAEDNNTWGIDIGNAIKTTVIPSYRTEMLVFMTGLKDVGYYKNALILSNWAYATFSGSLKVASGQYLGTNVVTSITFAINDTGTPLFQIGSKFTLYGVL